VLIIRLWFITLQQALVPSTFPEGNGALTFDELISNNDQPTGPFPQISRAYPSQVVSCIKCKEKNQNLSKLIVIFWRNCEELHYTKPRRSLACTREPPCSIGVLVRSLHRRFGKLAVEQSINLSPGPNINQSLHPVSQSSPSFQPSHRAEFEYSRHIGMFSIIWGTTLILVFSYAVVTVRGLQRNINLAKQSGLKYTITP
jgi:hypothetical protein